MIRKTIYSIIVCGCALVAAALPLDAHAEDVAPDVILQVSRAIADWEVVNKEDDGAIEMRAWRLFYEFPEGNRAADYTIFGLTAGNEQHSLANIAEFYWGSIPLSGTGYDVFPLSNTVYSMWKMHKVSTPQKFYEATRNFSFPLGVPIKCYGDAVRLLDSDMLSWPDKFNMPAETHIRGLFNTDSGQLAKSKGGFSDIILSNKNWNNWAKREWDKGRIDAQEFRSLYGTKTTHTITIKSLPVQHNDQFVVLDTKSDIRLSNYVSKWQGDLGRTFSHAWKNYHHQSWTNPDYLSRNKLILSQSKINYFQRYHGYPATPMQGNFSRYHYNP